MKPQTSFLKLLTYNGISQLLVFLTMPLLTRIYSPEDFGYFSTFISIITVVSIITTLNLEDSIPVQKFNYQAVQIMIFTIAGIVVIIMAISSFKILIIDQLLSNAYTGYHLFNLTAFGTFLVAVNNLISRWFVRINLLHYNSISKLFQTILFIFLQVILYKLSYYGIIYSFIISYAFINILVFKIPIRKNLKFIRLRKVIVTFKRAKQFYAYGLPSRLVNAISTNILPIVLLLYFSATDVGYFAFALRILYFPATFFSQVVSQSFFRDISNKDRKHSIAKIFEKYIKNMVYVCFPFFIIIGLLSEELTIFIFGEEWLTTGVIMKYMIPWILFNILYSPVSMLPIFYEKQDHGLYYNIILLLLRVIAIAVGVYNDNFFITIILYTVISTLYYYIIINWLCFLTKLNCLTLNYTFVANTLIFLIIYLPFYFLFKKFDLHLLTTGLLSVIIYGSYFVYRFRDIILEQMNKFKISYN